MKRLDIAVAVFAVGYSLFWIWLLQRAARFRRPGLSLYARLGLGWSLFRAENYTPAGQRARRQLIVAYVAGLPAFLLWVWFWSSVNR